jgi:uncharacterized protein YndB with AHSA1/START domain
MTDHTTMETAAGRSRTIVLERTLRVSVEDAWALWTTKEGFESWWGPEGFRVEVHRIEPRVGGALAYDMIAEAPEQIEAMDRMGQPRSHATHGTFTEVQPRERLAITHVIDFLPGVAPYDSTVVVEFRPAGPTLRMVITLAPMHDAHWTEMAVAGWTSQLRKLEARFRP